MPTHRLASVETTRRAEASKRPGHLQIGMFLACRHTGNLVAPIPRKHGLRLTSGESLHSSSHGKPAGHGQPDGSHGIGSGNRLHYSCATQALALHDDPGARMRMSP
ncbi:hypothetical protein BD309DRAFT_954256 [Dichomitus squalens]|nr:hypothetical protein BD309DRAFT_954256 [Dichomitus squalens]